jgi:hypothetical protein
LEPLLIYPENAAQLKTVKAVLKALKVSFEPPVDPPLHILKTIKDGLAEYDRDGKSISFEEFKDKHFMKK